MNNETLRQTLIKHLDGGQAFMPIAEMLDKISFEKLHVRPHQLPYSFYELFYHIWFSQKDILEYCEKLDYKAASWPQDYWPSTRGPKDLEEWKRLKNDFLADREKLKVVITSGEYDLGDPVPSNKEHSFLREILLVIEHTSYHSGQLLILLRHLGLHNS